MAIRSILAIGACGMLWAFAGPANAQDAAETATILTGQGGTAKAQRSLGGAVSGSLDNAASAIRPSRSSSRGASSRRSRRGGNSGSIVLTTNDPLEGTDAATYQTSNGTTIRVSGRMNPSASTACVNHCPEEKPES